MRPAFADYPPQMAFCHRGARAGFEVAFARPDGPGWTLSGTTAGLEDGIAWAITYVITLDAAGHTRRALIESHTPAGPRRLTLDADGAGRWHLDGAPAPALTGLLDVDLAASALTNTLPVRRLALEIGATADAPAAWVLPDLRVERLEQTYRRLPDDGATRRHAYAAPTLDFACTLVQDRAGVILDYPPIATRAR
ncbi:MAG: putative glycolipid-binding domain-containing protein [Myxococcales bacterium]|nr:putative glycolipid-binding domain-containing protein [Myxococcales bacterium]